MQKEYRTVSLSEITPYSDNPRINDQAVEDVVKSIEQCGYISPIVVDEDGIILAGHTRMKALQKLHRKEADVIVVSGLSFDQKRKYRLLDNKLGEEADWDLDLLEGELEGLDFDDLELDWGLDDGSDDDPEDGNNDWQLYRTTRSYENLEHAIYEGVGEYDIPQLSPVYCDCKDWIGFNFAKTCTDPEKKGVHFFVDDYQFTRLWERPDLYLPLLQTFQAVMSPDFSMYTDFPKAIQIYNHYRKHWLGAYWSEAGIMVIPTIAWGDEKSFDFCFDGEPVGSCVAISTVGTQNSKEAKELFANGYNEMIRRLSPAQIIVNGNMPEDLKQDNIEYIELEAFQEKWNE